MLAFITSYWFVALPGVLTGLYLLKVLNKAREENASKGSVPVTIDRRK